MYIHNENYRSCTNILFGPEMGSTSFSFDPNITNGSLFGGRSNLTVYNSLGQKVADLVGEYKEAGRHKATFYAKGFTTCVYYYKIQAGEFVEAKKMVLLR